MKDETFLFPVECGQVGFTKWRQVADRKTP